MKIDTSLRYRLFDNDFRKMFIFYPLKMVRYCLSRNSYYVLSLFLESFKHLMYIDIRGYPVR